MATRAIAAMVMAFCVATDSAAAGLRPIGVIVYANSSEVGTNAASAGSSLYEGERLTTNDGGELGIRSGAAMLRLEERTTAVLRGMSPGKADTVVELESGTVIFSTARASAVRVEADGALISPTADVATISNVRVISPKELRIFARRGSVQFTYRNDSAQVEEGSCYRVLLDPDDKDAPSVVTRQEKRDGHRDRAFLLIAIGAGGAASAIGLSHHHHHPHESPERP